MRSVNLLPKHHILLSDWKSCLLDHFDTVQLEHAESLAKREGHPAGAWNKLLVEDGREHLFILDRPTTIREYGESEITVIEHFTPRPEQFFAVDFTDKALLLRMLRILLEREGPGSLLVEDEGGGFVPVEDFTAGG